MRLSFPERHAYFPWRQAYHPLLPVEFNVGLNSYPTLAILDSGADYSLFPASIAVDLGLNLTDGREDELFGIAGSALVYFHRVSMTIGNSFRTDLDVAFSDETGDDYTDQLIGRDVIFDSLRFAFQQRKYSIHIGRDHR